jgi:hypothetical protein
VRAAGGAPGLVKIGASVDLGEGGCRWRKGATREKMGRGGHLVKVPRLGRMDEVELKAAALLRMQQFFHWGREDQPQRANSKALNGNIPVPSSLASSRTTSAST